MVKTKYAKNSVVSREFEYEMSSVANLKISSGIKKFPLRLKIFSLYLELICNFFFEENSTNSRAKFKGISRRKFSCSAGYFKIPLPRVKFRSNK